MIKTKNIISIFFQIVIIILSYIFLPNIIDFRVSCIVGSVFVILSFINLLLFSKEKVNPFNILVVCFILFQFGLPFLYALNSDYSNWYITQFNTEDLIYCVNYSVICIEFFILGAYFVKNKLVVKKNKHLTCFSDFNSKAIYKIGLILFVATSIIVIPITIYVVYLALINGYNYVKVDSMNLFNGITRFGQGLIVPALILLIIYAPSNRARKFYYFFSIFYGITLLFTGGRTTTISMIISMLFLNLKLNPNNSKSSSKLFSKKMFIAIGVIFLAVMGVWVAQIRYYGYVKSFSLFSIFESLVEEMGGSFIPFSFTHYYIPTTESFKYGLSYIYSFICLIPKSLDPTGFITSINSSLPEFWIANKLHSSFGNLYDFGIGYSVIAESYYNFGSWGVVSIFIQSIIINKLVNVDYSSSNSKKFRLYIEMVMLFSLVTYPRRSFFTLLKGFEYYILGVALLIIIYCKGIKLKNRGDKNENFNNLS